MKTPLHYMLVLLFIVITGTGFAQTEDDDYDYWDDYEFELWDDDNRPQASLSFGFTNASLHNAVQDFSPLSIAEIRLGFQEFEEEWEGIWELEANSFGFASISNEMGKKQRSGEIGAKMWRISMNREKGYGYCLGDVKIIPVTGSGLTWTTSQFNGPVPLLRDRKILNLYSDAFRFGTQVQAGLQVRVGDYMGVQFGYERNAVFSRTMFWKWAGSAILEEIGNGLIDQFVKRVFRNAPAAVPVVNVLLKGAYSFGVYQLRAEKMNYPFDSEPPMMHDSFKFGLVFTL